MRSFFKWIWDASGYVFAVYFIILGIYEMWTHRELYPWFIVMVFGLSWFLRMIGDHYAEQAIQAYKDLAGLWEGTAEKLFKQVIELTDSLYDVRVENDKLKRKQRQWN